MNVRLWLLVIISCLEISLFGGIQYGWSSILFILKAEGLYRELCKNDTDSQNMTNLSTSKPGNEVDICFSQDKRFNLLYSIAMALTSIFNVVPGEMQYKIGIKQTRIISILIFIAGALMLGFTSVDIPWLVSPGMTLTGVAGVSLFISHMQVAALLEKWSSIYLGIINGLFDSSVLTQRIVKKLFQVGIGRLYSYSGMVLLVVVISGTCTVLFPSESKESSNCKKQDNGKDEDFKKDDTKDKTLRTITLSKTFLLHIVWKSCLDIRLFYYLGSINRTMEQIFKDNGLVSYYTDVLAYTMIGGIIPSYFAGQSIHLFRKCFNERFVIAISMSITSGLAVLLSCLTFAVSHESLYTSFIALTVFRSYLYTVHLQFFMSFFPQKYRILLIGIVGTVCGVLTLVEFPLFSWTNEYMAANMHSLFLASFGFIFDLINCAALNYFYTLPFQPVLDLSTTEDD